MEALLAMNHRREDIMRYSPRQLEAFYELGVARENEQGWLDASRTRLAFHADDSLFSKKIKTALR